MGAGAGRESPFGTRAAPLTDHSPAVMPRLARACFNKVMLAP